MRFLADPFPLYRALREHDPIHRMPDGSYFLRRYDGCARSNLGITYIWIASAHATRACPTCDSIVPISGKPEIGASVRLVMTLWLTAPA